MPLILTSVAFFYLCLVSITSAAIQIPLVTTNRLIQVQVVPPAGAVQVKLSQDPTFRETTNGVAIQLTTWHSNLDYAVVNVTYPNGKPGGHGAPAALPAGRRDVRILAVLAKLSDGGEVPAYATPAWLDRIMFNDTEGTDARGVRNNVKAYWDQTSHGRVRISGDVYTQWVVLKDTSSYINLPTVSDTPTLLTLDTIAAIKQQNPSFFDKETYDFIVVLFPGDLAAVYNGYYEQTSSIWNDPNGIFGGYLTMDLPVEWKSKYFGWIQDETNTAIDYLHVQTRFEKRFVTGVFLASDTGRTLDYLTNHAVYFGDKPITLDRPLPENNSVVVVDYSTDYLIQTNAALDALHVDTDCGIYSMRGVWLASDTSRAGTNFFTDGSYTFRDNHIMLGRSLPASNTVVIVEFTSAVFFRLWNHDAPFFSDQNGGGWYGTFLHEMAHGLGPHIAFTDSENLGDLYQGADEIFRYGLMSGGNHNSVQPDNTSFVTWESPAHLDAYVKYNLGFLLPLELRYGESESNLVICATEEFPCTTRTKLVKVPLRPAGDLAYRRTDGFDYSGEEYLLLELRKRGEVPGIYNFDQGLPHEGLLIYHVIERDPRIIGAFWQNMVKIIDATPATPADWFWNTNYGLRSLSQSSFDYTAVPFGRDSGVTQYVHGEFWQEIGDSNLTFRLKSSGPLTVYAKFRDCGTNESEVFSATVLYVPGGADANTNGIADSWEQRYFGTTNTPPGFAEADADHDGQTNLQEFLAGTNPTSAASRLEISIRRDNEIAIEVPTVPGRSYVCETARDLARSRWYPFNGAFPMPGTAEVISFYGSFPASDTRFYRVRITPDE